MARYTVRKLDTEDDWWFVVDLTVRGAAILVPDAVVDRFISYEAAPHLCRSPQRETARPRPGAVGRADRDSGDGGER